MSVGQTIPLSESDRAVFARAAALAFRLRGEARAANPQFDLDSAAADRALYAVEYMGQYLADLGFIRLEADR